MAMEYWCWAQCDCLRLHIASWALGAAPATPVAATNSCQSNSLCGVPRVSRGVHLQGALQQTVIPTAVAQGNTLDFLAPLAVLHLLQCIPRCHGVLQRMLSMSPRMRVLYHRLHVQMESMHHNSQPTITNVSGTYKAWVRTALCAHRASGTAATVLRSMAAQARSQAYARTSTTI